MCASGPARLHSRGAGRCAVLRGRGPPWRRCWRCPWCWSGTQPCRTGREVCAARPRRLLILISSSRLGQSSPGASAICFLRKSLLRAWHVSCVVLPVFLPSLPTPSSPCRCGFDVFQHAPFLSGAVQVPPSSSKGCPRGGVAKEPSWGGQSCLRAAQRGGGLSLSQDSRLPHPTLLCPLLVCLPCPGWDRFLLYLGRLVSRRVAWWGLWMFVMVGKRGRREKWNQQAKIYIYKYQSIGSLSWQRRVIRKNTSDFTQDPWCILLHSILSAKSRCSAWQPTKLLSLPPM